MEKGDQNGVNNDIQPKSGTITSNRSNKRSGKTSLHFAARYGHNHIIEFLLNDDPPPNPKTSHQSHQKEEEEVDIPSNDGTTPLHLACYGGHYNTVVLLIETYHADPTKVNDWGCSAAHWAAMSVCHDPSSVQICHYLKHTHYVPFTSTQKQNHTPLHKAAQRLNSFVIGWFYRSKEDGGAGLTTEEFEYIGQVKDYAGGNVASDIWIKMGGSEEFGLKMKRVFQC
eukprot:2168494-Ditylum_brightwellii.AAC.1